MSAFSQFMKLFVLAGGVKATRNPVTGKVKKVQVGAQAMFEPLLCGKRAAMVRPFYFGNTSSNANVTRHGALILPIKPFAAKMRMLNMSQSSTITMQGAIASASSIADPIGNSLAWTRATFSGANTVVMPVGTNGAQPASLFSIADSDLITLDPAAYDIGTVLMYRTHALESGNTYLSGSMADASMFLTASGIQGYFQSGIDAVTTPSGFTSPNTHPSLPPCGLILYADDDVIRVSVYGSSTPAGTGDTTNGGWANRMQKILSTDSLAYIFTNSAVPGTTSQDALKRFNAEMALGYLPDMVVFNPFSSNDTDLATTAALSRLKGQTLYFVDECRRRGVVPVLQLAQAATGQNGTTLTNRRAINDFSMSIAASGNCRALDLASLLSDETASVGTWKDLSLTDDGIHPNAAGHALIAASRYSVFA